MDRLSTLPDHLIDLILERLPLIDRVRTSTLSTIWRLKWTHIPSLILDKQFHSSLPTKHSNQYERRLGSNTECDLSVLTCSRLGSIDCILSQYDACLRDFYLYDPGSSSCPLYSYAIYYAISNRRTLEILSLKCVDHRNSMWSLLSTTFSLINLRHLEIAGFVFEPSPSFEGFPNLTRFLLSSFKSKAEIISHFVNVCPRLEEVILKQVQFVHNVDLKAPHLRHLHISGFFQDVFVSKAQNLQYISWKIPPLLYEEEESKFDDMFKFLNNLLELKHISLRMCACKYLGRCKVIHMLPRFSQMMRLEFDVENLHDLHVLQCVLSFCACSPNMRDLTIKLPKMFKLCTAVDQFEFTFMVEKYIKEEYGHLMNVDLIGINGTDTEMKIIEMLLHFSPVLEVMHISIIDIEQKLHLCEIIRSFH